MIAELKACATCRRLVKHYHKTYCRDCWQKQEKARFRKRRAEAIAKLGDACICCGETIKEFLTIDHVNNNGIHHRSKPYQLIKSVLEEEDEYQLMCMNCNWGRRWTGICPHKIAKEGTNG